MERIRERFSTNIPSQPPPPSRIPPTPPTPPSSVPLPPAERSHSSTIVLQLKGQDHLLYEPTGVVEFYRPNEGVSCTVSSSRYIAHKVVALQGIYELLDRENRSDLDPLRESPIVHAILSTFRSKKECLDEIHWRTVDLEMRTVLSGWANDVWVDGEGKQGKQRGSDGESSDGSLFNSESDGGNSEGGRVRPITLRPRRTLNTPAPPTPSKSSTSRTPTSIRPAHLLTTLGTPSHNSMATQTVTTKTTRETSPIQNVIRVAPLTGCHETMPKGVKDERSARRINRSHSLACPPRSKLERMGSSFSNSAKEASQVATKKRALPAPSAAKRYKVSPGVTSSPIRPQAFRPQASHTTILESLSQTINPQAPPTEPTETERYVVKYWGEVQTRLSAEFRTSSTTEQLAHYFRQMEHLKQELDILKKDEKARRHQMVLIGEKIKLMNQPVVRDPQ